MNYMSLEHIRKEFRIDASEPEAIRRELIRQLKKIHPDLSSAPGTAAQSNREDVLNITAALRFMDESRRDAAVVPADDLPTRVRSLRSLVPQAIDRQRELKLAQHIEATVKSTGTVGRSARILLAAGAGLLSVFWLFPPLSQSHPILRDYIHIESPLFTLLWLAVLLYTGLVWFVCKLWTERQVQAHKRLILESTHNSLFENFIALKSRFQRSASPILFSKDELVQHIAGSKARGPAAVLLGRARPLDAELAQTIAEIILAKAVRRGIIQQDKQQSLRDRYWLLSSPGEL